MDKVPHKKRKKQVKMPVLLIALLLAAALCAGGLVLLRRPVYPAPKAAEKNELLSRPKAEIAALEIISQEYGAYTLSRQEDGSMMLSGKETLPLRPQIVEHYLNAAAQMESAEVVYESMEGQPLAPFGLDEPALRLLVTYEDGEQKEVRVGTSVQIEENTLYYCTATGDERLHVMLESQCEIFFHDAFYLLDFRQPQLDASLLDEIRLTGEKELTLAYTPVGWLMKAPFVYPAEPQKMQTLLSRIESIAFEAYLGPEQQMNLKDFGLETPALTVTLCQAATVITGETADGQAVSLDYPAVRHELRLGADNGKSAVYVLWKGGVYRASNFLLGFLKEMEPESLLCRKPIHFLINQLTSLTLEGPGLTRRFDITMVESMDENNRPQTDEYGQTLYDAEITENGMRTDAAAFLFWYTELAALSPAGRMPEGYPPAEEAALAITLETDSQVRRLAFTPYDALHDALWVDGVSLFFVDRAFRETALQGP